MPIEVSFGVTASLLVMSSAEKPVICIGTGKMVSTASIRTLLAVVNVRELATSVAPYWTLTLDRLICCTDWPSV